MIRSQRGMARYPSDTPRECLHGWLARASAVRGACVRARLASRRAAGERHGLRGPMRALSARFRERRPRTKAPVRAPDGGTRRRTGQVRRARLTSAAPVPPSRPGRTVTRGWLRSQTACPRTSEERFLKRKSPEDETASGLLSQRLAAPEGVCSRGRLEKLRLEYRQIPPKTQLAELLCYPSEAFEVLFQRSG